MMPFPSRLHCFTEFFKKDFQLPLQDIRKLQKGILIEIQKVFISSSEMHEYLTIYYNKQEISGTRQYLYQKLILSQCLHSRELIFSFERKTVLN